MSSPKVSVPDNELLVFHNVEKEHHEKWYKGRDLLDFPHPFRCVISASPNTGKTNIIKNIIYRCQKGKNMFKRLYLLHGDIDNLEYDDIKFKKLTEVPKPEKLTKNNEKSLLVVDDYITSKKMNKEDEKRLSMIMSTISTHHDFSVIITTQYITYIPVSIRTLANIHIVSKINNMLLINATASYIGIPVEKFKEINDKYLIPNPHATLWVDSTYNTPARYRINGYEVLKI